MAQILTGTRSSDNIAQVRRTVDIRPDIENTSIGDFPFVILMTKLRRMPVDDPRIRWMEDEYVPQVDAINNGAGHLAGDLVLDVDNAAFFNVGDQVYVTRTEESLMVTAVDTTLNKITVERSWGDTAAAALVDDDELLIVGPATKEGDDAPDPRTTVTVEKFNFVQIWRDSYRLTRMLSKNMKLLTDPDTEYQRSKKLEEHMIKIERSLFFGERREDVATTASSEDPRRSMGGIRQYVTTNITTVGGVLTKSVFDGFLKTAFRKGSRRKFLFASDTVNASISAFADSVLRTVPAEETFGIHTTEYISPHGRVTIIEEKLFAESTKLSGQAFLLDLEMLWWRANEDTHRRENIQNPGERKTKEEYVTSGSLEARNEEAHAILKDVT